MDEKQVQFALQRINDGLITSNTVFNNAIHELNKLILLPLSDAFGALKQLDKETPALLQPVVEMKMEFTSAPTFSELLTEYLDLRDNGPDESTGETDKNYYTRIIEIPKLLDEIIYGRRTN